MVLGKHEKNVFIYNSQPSKLESQLSASLFMQKQTHKTQGSMHKKKVLLHCCPLTVLSESSLSPWHSFRLWLGGTVVSLAGIHVFRLELFLLHVCGSSPAQAKDMVFGIWFLA